MIVSPASRRGTPRVADLSTESSDYGSRYYEDFVGGSYDESSEHWREFFDGIAAEIIRTFNPESVLDAGCAKGLLVSRLREKGVEAWGVDISQHAIEFADSDIRNWLFVQSLTEPLSGRYDLITCIEVLEHMAPQDGRVAIQRLTSVADRIVFSSSPNDFAEPTHTNVRSPGYWAAEFAKHGFLRRLDIDFSLVAPWAVVFERGTRELSGLVLAYEDQWWRLQSEVHDKRQALLECARHSDVLAAEVDAARGQTRELEHRQQVIDDVAQELEHRQQVIDDLAQELEHRQQVIDDLAAEAEYRLAIIEGRVILETGSDVDPSGPQSESS